MRDVCEEVGVVCCESVIVLWDRMNDDSVLGRGKGREVLMIW